MTPSRSLAPGIVALLMCRPAAATTSCGQDCYQADSCEQAAVQAAVDAALAQSGGTVKIPDPPGAPCQWGKPVQIDGTLAPLAVMGQSQDTTHIRVSEQAFDVVGKPGVKLSLSELKLSDASCTGQCDSIIGVGGGDQWRFHHLRFETTGVFTRLFRSYGETFGLIDHVIVTGSTPSEFVTVDDSGFAAWKRPLDLGSAAAVYIEDCDIAFTGSWEGRPFDGENGGRMVVRKNKIRNQMLGSHGLDSGFGASMFSVVAYSNSFVLDDDAPAWSSKTWGRLAHFRGGTGILYDNDWTVGGDIWIGAAHIDLAIYRTPTDAGGNEHWQPCDGSQYRMCSNIAKGWDLQSGNYPYNCKTDQDCADKIGAGTTCKWKLCSVSKLELCAVNGDCPSGETCSGYLDGPGAGGYPCYMQPGYASQMQRAPWYEWGNTRKGGEGSSGCSGCDVDFGENVSQLEQGRDYYDDVPVGTTLPASCKPRDGFFHTADKTLYTCDASGKWQKLYTEFPYPHPLQGGASGGTGGSSGSGGAAGGGAGGATGGSSGGGAAGAGGADKAGADDDGGCGCALPQGGSSAWSALALAVLAARARRRRPS